MATSKGALRISTMTMFWGTLSKNREEGGQDANPTQTPLT